MNWGEGSPLLLAAIGAVALLYASVGHGGASGYLAVLSLAGLGKDTIAASALALNLAVATIAFVAYRQVRAFSWRLTWPFVVGAAPFALVGSSLKVSDRAYFVVVGIVLVWAGIRLLWPDRNSATDLDAPPPVGIGVLVGAGIGFLSGIVGVGGGIFLSPVLVLAGWADPRRTSATSAIFIVSNSAIGLATRAAKGVTLPPSVLAMLGCGIAGALVGSWVGARMLPSVWLRRVLGAVLLMAAFKLLWKG